MDAITLPNSSQLYVVVGGRAAAGRMLELAARLAQRGPLLMLDCGNRANPLPLVRELRRLTPDPAGVLRQARAARAFTCWQAAALLEEAARTSLRQPVLIFDLLATFYDESVTYREANRLLEQALDSVTHLRQSAPVVISARPAPVEFPERRSFLKKVCDLSDALWVEEDREENQPRQLSFFS